MTSLAISATDDTLSLGGDVLLAVNDTAEPTDTANIVRPDPHLLPLSYFPRRTSTARATRGWRGVRTTGPY